MYIFKLHIPIIKSYSLFLCRAIPSSQTQIPILFICKAFRNPFCLLSFVFENFYILVGDTLINSFTPQAFSCPQVLTHPKGLSRHFR